MKLPVRALAIPNCLSAFATLLAALKYLGGTALLRLRFPVTFVLSAVLAGCASPVHIVKPEGNPNVDPIPQITVSFLSNFNPSNPWDVYLDGTALSGWSPAPGPGVTSSP